MASNDQYDECHHVFANGTTCCSPALTGEIYCYFHIAARDRLRRQRVAAARKLPLQIAILENADAIQLAITDVTNAMLAGRIGYREAALALYALQTASANIRNTHFIDADSDYERYHPEHDAGLPEEPPAEPQATTPPKKPAAPATPGKVIPKIEASIDPAHRNPPAPIPAAQIQRALKRLKKISSS